MKARPLAPRGGNDRVYTPPEVARQIVAHFAPSGICLEPCSGKGAFVDALVATDGVLAVQFCEIDAGIDFFSHTTSANWIVTNPPWSKFRSFLNHSMELADNVVFLSLVNAFWMKARIEDMRRADFGIREILLLDTPPPPWPQTGFQLGATWIARGWTGGIKLNRL